MKTFLLTVLGIIAAIVILATIGPLGGLLFSLAIAYASLHFYIKASTSFAKIVFALVGIAAVVSMIANFPGILGLAALIGLYMLYKKGIFSKKAPTSVTKDPFANFEKEWSNLMK